jgi:hypothetical protein
VRICTYAIHDTSMCLFHATLCQYIDTHTSNTINNNILLYSNILLKHIFSILLNNSILAGPAFEYKEYIDTVTGDAYKQKSYSEVVTAHIDTASSDNTNGNSVTVKLTPPNRTLPVLSKLLTGLVCAVIHQVTIN